ncbi:MAG: hypothetical protein K2H13_02960 [Eubacterium sp.]|nr:hypothetical protein [Eubacterium sp.]MDE6154801.1 hypothetical protein [Eubacterium sp.]
MKNDACPKCGKKLSPFYMKDKCPYCGVNLLYYNLDENLKADAELAQKEVDTVNKFLNIIKSSSIVSPVLIVRLVLFFTPLASMCLPMYDNVSLITVIMGLIKSTVEIGDVMMPLVSMALVVVLSLAVIISSLFSSTKAGFIRNIVFSVINTTVFIVFGVIIGGIGIGWYLTLIIYILEIIMHIICNRVINKNVD